MAYAPTPAGPKNIRELFHWCYGQFSRVGTELEPLPFQSSAIDQFQLKIQELEARIETLETP